MLKEAKFKISLLLVKGSRFMVWRWPSWALCVFKENLWQISVSRGGGVCFHLRIQTLALESTKNSFLVAWVTEGQHSEWFRYTTVFPVSKARDILNWLLICFCLAWRLEPGAFHLFKCLELDISTLWVFCGRWASPQCTVFSIPRGSSPHYSQDIGAGL